MQNPTGQPAPTPPLLLQHQLQHQQRRSSTNTSTSSSNSPEFEFWMIRNPTQPQPDLLSADQLFLDGVLLPLHLLHLNHPENKDDPPPEPDPKNAEDAPSEPGPRLASTYLVAEPPTTSKRWTDIFKWSEKKSPILTGSAPDDKNRGKQRRDKRVGSNNPAVLKVNLWPFLRSISEGNSAVRPKLSSRGPTTRKVSSAPCSRSNSGGDPKFGKWPGSPARPGLHLSRTSPVWQVKRSPRASIDSGKQRRVSKVPRGGSGWKARVLNLNMPLCRTDENVGIGHVTGIGIGGGGGGGGRRTTGNTFNLRGLFTKKVH